MCLDPVSSFSKAGQTGAAWRDKQQRVVDTRSRAFSAGLQHWMERYARRSLKDAKGKLDRGGIKALKRSAVRKVSAKESEMLARELFELYRKYGLSQMVDGAKDAARSVGHRPIIQGQILAEMSSSIENQVVLLVEDTESMVRSSINSIVSQALRETPLPTVGELGRRIAREWLGPAKIRPTSKPALGLRGSPEEQLYTADWRRSQDELDADREHLFSFTRATTIARNEIAQARNMGIAEGFKDAGVELVKWIAYRNDGRSGKRMHYKMNAHKALSVAGLSTSDTLKWFKLPNGERARHPHAAGMSAFNRIN